MGAGRGGFEEELIFEYNLTTGEKSVILQSNFKAEVGAGYVVGGERSIDNSTGEESITGYIGGNIKAAQGQIGLSSDGYMTLEVSGGDPEGAFGQGFGVSFNNSRNIDLTAVRYNDVAKYSRQGGLQDWVLRVTGLPMKQYIGPAWDNKGLIALGLSRQDLRCKYIDTYETRHGQVFSGETLFVPASYCLPQENKMW